MVQIRFARGARYAESFISLLLTNNEEEVEMWRFTCKAMIFILIILITSIAAADDKGKKLLPKPVPSRYLPASVTLSPARAPSVVSATPSRPACRAPCRHGHVPRLATGCGEKYGLARRRGCQVSKYRAIPHKGHGHYQLLLMCLDLDQRFPLFARDVPPRLVIHCYASDRGRISDPFGLPREA